MHFLSLPDALAVEGRLIPINADFKLWYSLAEAVEAGEDAPLEVVEQIFCHEEPVNISIVELRQAMINFLNPRELLPRPSDLLATAKPLISYELDKGLIFASFYQSYGINLNKIDLHWHEFLALLKNIKDCKLTEVIGYRSYDKNMKNVKIDYEEEMRKAWELPQEEENSNELDRLLGCE